MANVDKSLYAAPAGIAAVAEHAPNIEVVLEGEPEVEAPPLPEADFYENLAETINPDTLHRIADDLFDSIKEDLLARREWERMYADGVNLLGLKYETRTEPWQGACGVFHPMITEAVIRFQADTIIETFPSSGPVKTTIVGKITDEKEKAAERVEDDLNWQLLENMPEFRPDHERMLWNLASAGCAFKKIYDCPILGRQTSVFVPAEDVIIPYGTTDLHTCERIAHRIKKTKHEAEKMIESGFWRDVSLPEPSPSQHQDDNIQRRKNKETGVSDVMDRHHTFYEVAVDINLAKYDSDAPKEEKELTGDPYIITFLENTGIVVSLRRNWKEDDEDARKRLHFVQYTYVPGYGAYGFGLFHLLGGFATSATSIIRQLVDAGTLSNLPGGLKTKGLRIKGDDQPIPPGEFRDVDVGSGTIKDNIMPLPYKEPSATLFQLMTGMVEEARRFAATNDLKISDMSAQAPVGTMLAVLERQLRTMTAVQARVHFAFKQELRLLADIIKEGTPEYAYEVDAPQGRRAKLDDYSMVSIIPVSDPNAATMSQRVVQYQAVIQLATSAPQIYDQVELHRQMLTVLGIKNVEKLIPNEDDIKLVDPVQENQNVLNCKPVKALAWQDHEAHIRVHQAAMTDPLIQQLVGQNPKAAQIQGAMTAHIAEHVGFAYRNRIQQVMGISLPSLGKDDELTPAQELQLSKMLAQAAPQVLQQSQQMVAQQQAQQNAQDPVLVAQQKEQENAAAEIARKKWKDEQDVQLNWKKLDLEAQAKGVDPSTLAAEQGREQQKVDGELLLKAQQQTHQQELEQQRFRHQKEMDGLKTGVAVAKEHVTAHHEHVRQSQERHIAASRAAAELGGKHEDRKRAEEKHQQELKLREERHKQDLENSRKQAAAASKEKPKEKSK